MEVSEPNSIVNEPVMTVLGVFKDNQITTQEGEVINCITYARVREQIDGKVGFYHLIKYTGHRIWAIFQYILLE